MTATFAQAWVLAVMLCALRAAPVWLLTPVLNGFALPARIKVFLLLGFSAALVSGLPPSTLPVPPQLEASALVLACGAELATGALLAFGVLTAFGAVAFAGKLLDVQLGFGLGNVYDPVTRSQSPLIGSLLGLLATVIFFSVDAHHTLLRGMAYSLEKLPLGVLLADAPAQAVIRQFGTVFSLGLAFGAPLVIWMFLIDIGLAVISRSLPQMNVLTVSVPAKIALGFVALAVAAHQWQAPFARVFAGIFGFWETALG